jgi:hypothetical protein
MNHYKISNYVYKITPEELPGHRLLIDGRLMFSLSASFGFRSLANKHIELVTRLVAVAKGDKH